MYYITKLGDIKIVKKDSEFLTQESLWKWCIGMGEKGYKIEKEYEPGEHKAIR